MASFYMAHSSQTQFDKIMQLKQHIESEKYQNLIRKLF